MNKKLIFVDTGAWFAIADKSDQLHKKATEHIKKLSENKAVLITSNLVVHETIMLLYRKLSKNAAIRFIDMIYNDENVEILQSNEVLEEKAYKTFKKYSDHNFSVVDCVPFVLMKEHAIKKAFTFDRHFKIMKFSVEP